MSQFTGEAAKATISMPRDMLSCIKGLAKRERRSVSELFRYAAEQYILDTVQDRHAHVLVDPGVSYSTGGTEAEDA